MPKLKEVRAALDSTADSVGYSGKTGEYIARRGFFYRHGYDADKFEAAVRRKLELAGLKVRTIETYEKWTTFRGGASVANSSHWGARFRLDEKNEEATEPAAELDGLIFKEG